MTNLASRSSSSLSPRAETADADPRSPAERGIAPDDATLVRRTLVLLALFAVADLWAYHHFAVGVRNIGIPVGIAAALGIAAKVAGFVMGVDTVNSAKNRVVEPVRGLLNRVVTPNVLWLSALLLLTAMLTVSSVTIVADAGGETGSRIAVTPIEERPGSRRWTTKADAGVTRVVITTPVRNWYIRRDDEPFTR